MEELGHSEYTRAGELANQRLIQAVLEPDLYPGGTTFLAADQEHFDLLVSEAVSEHRPLAIVYADGREIIATPRNGALAFFGHLLARRRKVEHRDAVRLPADYVVELRDPQPLATS
jgi:hypothetical protein